MGGHLLSCRTLDLVTYHEVNFPYLHKEGSEPNAHSSPIEHKHSNSLKARSS